MLGIWKIGKNQATIYVEHVKMCINDDTKYVDIVVKFYIYITKLNSEARLKTTSPMFSGINRFHRYLRIVVF